MESPISKRTYHCWNFFLYLHRWLTKIDKNKDIPEFQYYSMEWDEDEPIISVMPFNDEAQLISIWKKEDLFTVFDLSYIVGQCRDLMEKLEKDIEEHYQVSLKTFIGKVPMRN